MVVVGQMNLIYQFDKKFIKPLSRNFAWLTEHLSNQTIPALPIKNFDVAISGMDEERQEQMAPDLLITYGGHIFSKQLKKYLRTHRPKEHWHITPDGKVADLFGCLTTVIEMDPFEFLEKIAFMLDNKPTAYPMMWENWCKIFPAPTLPYSQISVTGDLIQALPAPCALHLANSSTVRYAQLFPLSNEVEVCCNRGVNGIEGSLSAALGYAAASERLNFVIIGDLSFFYDMNALWCTHFHNNLRILLINNDGGEIFHTLPGMDKSGGTSRRFITAEHHTSAKGWAEERGFQYSKVTNAEEWQEALQVFASPEEQPQPMFLEVMTDKGEDTRLLREYYKSLKNK
jgi:2-succinyl-5-enolpyruvyl-6-hydroxy-3-cyclohexene-1-carboxylate synthase